MKDELSKLAGQIRWAYAEHLIRCSDPEPEDMEELLRLDGAHEEAFYWLAFGYAKRRYDPDHVRGLLVYLISQYPAPHEDPARRELLVRSIQQKKIGLSDLTIEKLCGTYLSWDEIFRLTGKEFNPSRTKEHVRKVYDELMTKSKERS
ncbi:MAG: hypothetical protein NZ610_04275 [Candidatus Bipolaricaulota bacterium]|nr:hypothetical protein [Candidatus Bipolaricaulota bacterium]MCS7274607.1 hypothetical protein [Candidatus Bipolaricaulota bacterium]MDW8110962.1 hypothetical protein [Candidatus Bipolaricaulota bacterium]MDW8329037.1 hypothetical protein [Candidatus Bipolaricaulota bacterium]